jgi:hypothetical protein
MHVGLQRLHEYVMWELEYVSQPIKILNHQDAWVPLNISFCYYDQATAQASYSTSVDNKAYHVSSYWCTLAVGSQTSQNWSTATQICLLSQQLQKNWSFCFKPKVNFSKCIHLSTGEECLMGLMYSIAQGPSLGTHKKVQLSFDPSRPMSGWTYRIR